MASTEVLKCSHGQDFLFDHIKKVQFSEGRALGDLTYSESLKKSLFFKKYLFFIPPKYG